MAKKVKKCFLDSITYEKLYSAYASSKKNKRYRSDIIKFSMRYEERLLDICKKLYLGKYNFLGFKEFYVYEPKKRRILAAPFVDRIVHTWYVHEFLEKIFVPSFISTSYACIKQKGMHKCVLAVKKAVYNANLKWERPYIIKMDVAKFFQNIDRKILLDIICRKISDKKFLSFTKKLLNSSSMYDIKEGIGLPIGNYSSQLFGNIYLNEVDRYAKDVLKCKYYFRYLDDTCIICKTKKEANYVLFKLKCFYAEKLHLVLNKKTDIFPIKNGIDFCGYKICRNGRIKIRNSGKKRLVKRLKKIRYDLRYNIIKVEDAKKSIAGSVGYISIANVNGLINKYFYIK